MKYKTILALTTVLFLTILLGASTILIPTISAHTPPIEITTHAYIAAGPNPIGVGQKVAIVMWLDKVIDGARQDNSIRFHDFNLTIIDPNGDVKTTIYPICEDTTSSLYTMYTPTVAGDYTLIFSYPGQVFQFTDLIPAMFGGPPSQSAYINDTYKASSAQTTLTVQTDPIPEPETNPLPTAYWTRPIEGQNWNWYTIASNWLGSLSNTFTSFACLQPDGLAPNSAHVMWTSPYLFGGVVGGTNVGVPGATYYTGESYEEMYTNAMILNGRLYYALALSDSAGIGGVGGSASAGFVCVDLQTGEQIWETQYPTNPSFAMLLDFETSNQHGVIPNGYLIATNQFANPYGTFSNNIKWGSPGTWVLYDALSGQWLFNITNVPSGSQVLGPNGEYCIYQYSAAKGRLAMWNSTQAIANSAYLAGGIGSMEGNTSYRPVHQIINGNLGWQWNISTPAAINITGSTLLDAFCNDVVLGGASIQGSMGGAAQGTPYTMWALNIDPEKGEIGSLKWIKTYTPPKDVTHMFGPASPESRVFTFSDKETMVWYGYSLDTGAELWGPTAQNHSPYDYYGNEGGNNLNGYLMYGNFYTAGYGGIVYCYDAQTGKELWTYGNGDEGNSTNSGLATVYGRYPVFITGIADGKVYAFTTEHSPGVPPYPGSLVRCINATTGEEIWTIDSWASSNVFIADGYLNYLNTYDMQIYTIGKGPSAMTVTAPDIATTLGTPIIIRGTVSDIAAGTQQTQQKANFPNGVPCVSDESESQWMAYVYMQKSKPTDVTGVPVDIYVLDSNNNYRLIGNTVSDSMGMFTYTWDPDISGAYTVTAVFGGSNSYYPCSAESSFYVTEPAPTATTAPEIALPPTELYIAAATAAIIVAIAIVGALILMAVRKRP
jgi:outer membrane protein assembly factor BamB